MGAEKSGRMIVCHVPKKLEYHIVGILTGRKKTSFSHLCILVIPYPIGTKYIAELPTSQWSPHSIFEGNRPSHFLETSDQSFNFFSAFFLFAHFAKIAINTNMSSDCLEIWQT